MPEIASFRGILFDPARADLPRVLAPLPGAADAHARAAAGWLASGLLVRDPYKAIYRLVQYLPVPGTARTVIRRGVIAAVRLGGTGEVTIRSPERVRPERVDEALATLDATRIQAGLPVAMYGDASGEIERVLRQTESKKPALDVTIGDVRHVLWRINDAEVFGKVRRAMAAKRVVLADGHHRYAAAVALRNRLDAATPLSPQASPHFTPMFLVNGADEGLIVRGAHRVLANVDGFEPRAFLTRARDFFVVDVVPGGAKDPAPVLRALAESPGHSPAIGVVFAGEPDAWRLALDAHVNPQALGVSAHPMVAKLSPSLLHGLIFERLLGLTPAAHEAGPQVRHVHDPAAALEQVAARRDGAQAAFLLPALSPDVLRNVAETEEPLPPRSAWLVGPMLPGIVMAAIDPDEDLL